jgi:tetratricopeptide (TPR) repeat protein
MQRKIPRLLASLKNGPENSPIMTTVAEAFALALHYYQAGDLQQSEHICRQILQAFPSHADSHHLLAVSAFQKGEFVQAINSVRRAIEYCPSSAVYHCTLGLAYQGQGELGVAIGYFREALRLQPDFAEAHNNLGNALCQQGELDQAVVHFQETIRLQPNCAQAFNNLGLALATLGQLDAAIGHYQHAVRLNPSAVEAHSNLSVALVRQNRNEEAIRSLCDIVRNQPNSAEAHFNLGVLFARMGKLDDACAYFRQAIKLNSNLAEAHTALGNALARQNRVGEALESLGEALRLNPDSAEAHWNRACIWLSQGDFERGWPEYEWRWGMPGAQSRVGAAPRWNGSPLHDATLLVFAEQGLGDTLQFIRYISLARERCDDVVLESPAALTPLLRGVPSAAQVVPAGTPLLAFAAQVPLLSMPAIFGTSVEHIPSAVPYLHADVKLVAYWQRELESLRPFFKIGIAWQGSPEHPDDRSRSIPLACFAALGDIPGAKMISLQKDPEKDRLAAIAGRFSLTELGNRLDEANGPFMDTAAIMQSLDLVISSDTSVVHLAGAMAVPVWAVLPLSPDWRWLRDRVDSPWYPSMRLFRQTQHGKWDDVFVRIATELKSTRPGSVP